MDHSETAQQWNALMKIAFAANEPIYERRNALRHMNRLFAELRRSKKPAVGTENETYAATNFSKHIDNFLKTL